jgi:hypothetical protein
MSEDAVLLIGEPETGKTNYIARLIVALDRGDCGLQITGLPDELNAFRTLASTLLGGKYVQHTKAGSTTQIVLDIARTSDNVEIGRVVVPDFAGEDCRKIVMNRRWSEAWESAVQSTRGILVFVRSTKLQTAHDWCELHRVQGAEELMRDFSGSELPSDILLVELLQLMFSAKRSSAKLKIGVVLSCWDEVPKEFNDFGPEAYAKENLPLLHQYLVANSDRIESRYLGVSSTSGDLNEPKYNAVYKEDPHAAGYVVSSDRGKTNHSKNLTLPVEWVLS